jgi:hypothetical protein
MPRERSSAKKKAPKGRTKPVSYELIQRESGWGKRLYPMVDELVEKHHDDLKAARIALAWNLTWKPDVDGRVTLGKCKRASDLDRELSAFDFVVILRKEFFEDLAVKDPQRLAILDHELCHAAPKLDVDGEQLEDDKGRKVWRLRKHDIEEFSEIVARHGCYKRDIEQFAVALRLSKQGKLNMEDVAESLASDPKFKRTLRDMIPKDGSIEIETGGTKVTLTSEDRARLDRELGERG